MKLLSRSKPDLNPALARKKGEECLATWWHQSTPGTTFWRCLVPARHLPGQTLPLAFSDLKQRKLRNRGELYYPRQRGSTAIFQFLGDKVRTMFALGMREVHGTRVLLEVDDNYTRSPPYMRNMFGRPWVETIAEAESPGGNGYSYEQHRRLLPYMDGIICSTPYLAELYGEFNPNVFVCPNSVDPADWEYEREEHDAFRIVYYGSSSHVVDTPLITKALKWASKQPGVEVWTAGFENPSWSFEHQRLPWTDDLIAARKNLFKFDLGVAPLKGNRWSRGKSDVKSLEYAMAGVLPLMSAERPYEGWAGEYPDLVVGDDQWMEAIQYWVKHRDEVPYAARGVKDWVLETRSIEKTIGSWRRLIA